MPPKLRIMYDGAVKDMPEDLSKRMFAKFHKHAPPEVTNVRVREKVNKELEWVSYGCVLCFGKQT